MQPALHYSALQRRGPHLATAFLATVHLSPIPSRGYAEGVGSAQKDQARDDVPNIEHPFIGVHASMRHDHVD